MIARALQDRGVYLTVDGERLNVELTAKCDRKDAQIAEMCLRFPFTATAFGTALEMLRASPLLALERDAAVP